MRYAHHHFLIYQITCGANSSEIAALCADRSLPVPSQSELRTLQKQVVYPPGWWHELDPRNTRHVRWLRDLGVLGAWREERAVQDAFQLYTLAEIRVTLEALLLLRNDLQLARTELGVRYDESLLPSVEVMQAYIHYFWDIGALNAEELKRTAESAEKDVRDIYQKGLRGDVAAVYRRVGLSHQVDSVQFLDDLISLTHSQILLARQEDGLLSGSAQLGLAALTRQGLEAVKRKDEILGRSGGEVERLRREATMFKMRQADPLQLEGPEALAAVGIVSLKDLDAENVIEARFNEK